MGDASDNETPSQSAEEPTLREIKELLTIIQGTISLIQEDNQKIKADIEELKASVRNKVRELNTLKTKLEKTNDAHSALAQVVNNTQNKL